MALTKEQREARRTGLGGSDAAVVLGLSPWKTPYQLYQEKVTGVESEEENEYMKWGSLLEPIIAAEFGARTGKALVPGLDTVRHKQHPFILANPDFYIEGERAGLEVKTASAWMSDAWGEGDDHVPQYYLTQGLHYCAVTGWDRCHFAVLLGGNQLRTYVVEADPEAIDIIVQAEVAFWNKHVLPQIPPPLTSTELNKRWATTTGQQTNATGLVYDAVLALKQLRKEMRLLDQRDSEMSALIKEAIADADELVFDGKKIAQWKFNKPGVRFDTDAFKVAHPDLYKAFIKDAPGPRVLRLS